MAASAHRQARGVRAVIAILARLCGSMQKVQIRALDDVGLY
jgi:hypothetical protein